MPLNFWCWNIQRINLAKVSIFAQEIRALVAERRRVRRVPLGAADGATRFRGNPDLAEVGIILENQTNSDAVCAVLQSVFNAKASGAGDLHVPYAFEYVRMGGAGSTAENLIIAYRNCARPRLRIQELSTLVLSAMVEDLAAERPVPTRRSRRMHGYDPSEDMDLDDVADIARDEAETFFDDLLRGNNWYRGLALLSVVAGARRYVVGTVHLPGPTSHARYSQIINRRIVSEFVLPQMMMTNPMVDVVMGDFNIHGPINVTNIMDLTHALIPSGTTIAETFDPTTGFMSEHQFDKCLVNELRVPRGTLDPGSLALIAPGAASVRIQSFREVTDHAGLFLFLP